MAIQTVKDLINVVKEVTELYGDKCEVSFRKPYEGSPEYLHDGKYNLVTIFYQYN